MAGPDITAKSNAALNNGVGLIYPLRLIRKLIRVHRMQSLWIGLDLILATALKPHRAKGISVWREYVLNLKT